MTAKTLKHKELADTFGHILNDEIYQADLPMLQPMTSTMEEMEAYFEGTLIGEQLSDYELITINLSYE